MFFHGRGGLGPQRGGSSGEGHTSLLAIQAEGHTPFPEFF